MTRIFADFERRSCEIIGPRSSFQCLGNLAGSSCTLQSVGGRGGRFGVSAGKWRSGEFTVRVAGNIGNVPVAVDGEHGIFD
jgi:hypothetical protein